MNTWVFQRRLYAVITQQLFEFWVNDSWKMNFFTDFSVSIQMWRVSVSDQNLWSGFFESILTQITDLYVEQLLLYYTLFHSQTGNHRLKRMIQKKDLLLVLRSVKSRPQVQTKPGIYWSYTLNFYILALQITFLYIDWLKPRGSFNNYICYKLVKATLSLFLSQRPVYVSEL